MKITVKTKPGDCQSPKAGMITTILFLGVSLFMIYLCFMDMDGVLSLENFMHVMNDKGIVLLIAIFFLLIALYFIKFLVSAPKQYRAVLQSMEVGAYNGQSVTWLELAVEKNQEKISYIRSTYRVYLLGTADGLETGATYTVGIKEFNWQLTYILTDASAHGANEAVQQTMKYVSLQPVLWGMYLIFGGTAFFGLFNMLLHLNDGLSCLYNLPAIIFGVGTCVLARVAVNYWNEDNLLKPNPTHIQKQERELEKLGILDMYMQEPKTAQRDNAYFAKKGLQIPTYVDLADVRRFKVIRYVKAIKADCYAIVGNQNALLYRVQPLNLDERNYDVYDVKGQLIAKVKKTFNITTYGYVVSMVGRRPFSVRKLVQMTGNYELVGTPFQVTGQYHAMRNIISDVQNQPVAQLSPPDETNSGWLRNGTSQVSLMEGYENSPELMLVCLCVTMGNWEEHSRYVS